MLYPRCWGLDVHTKTVVACCILSTEGRKPVQEPRTCRTLTTALLAWADWLQEQGGTHGAMERPGVYWRPGYNGLAGQ